MDGEITDPCDFEQLGMGQAYRFSDDPGEHKKTPAISLWEPQGMVDAPGRNLLKISGSWKTSRSKTVQNCNRMISSS